MLIQKELEAKICAAFDSACSLLAFRPIIKGAWETALSGLLKWVENPADANKPAYLSISVSCPSWGTLTTPVVDFAVSVSLFIRPELDPTGAALVEISEKVENVLKNWQLLNDGTFAALDIADALSVDGISLGGGSSPIVNDGVCNVSWNFTLSGHFL